MQKLENPYRKQRDDKDIPPLDILSFTHLFVFLEEDALRREKCSGELYFTKLWLRVNATDRVDFILQWLTEHDIHCDCEVEKKVLQYF